MKRAIVANTNLTETDSIKLTLSLNNFSVVGESSNGMSALKQIRLTNPDIAILDDKLPVLDGMQVAKILNEENLAPTILLISSNNLDLIERAKNLVTSFLVRPYQNEQLYATIKNTIAFQERFNKLQTKVDKLQENLENRKIIEKAKGVLMQKKGFSENNAYKAMQQLAMKKRISLRELAEYIIKAYEKK